MRLPLPDCRKRWATCSRHAGSLASPSPRTCPMRRAVFTNSLGWNSSTDPTVTAVPNSNSLAVWGAVPAGGKIGAAEILFPRVEIEPS